MTPEEVNQLIQKTRVAQELVKKISKIEERKPPFVRVTMENGSFIEINTINRTSPSVIYLNDEQHATLKKHIDDTLEQILADSKKELEAL